MVGKAARRWVTAVAVIFVLSVALNFAWEMAQSVFFAPMGATLAQGVFRCLRASLGDAVIVLLIALIVAAALRHADWFLRPQLVGYVLVGAVGMVLAVALEWISLRQGRWSYRPEMPVIPGLGIGLVPVLQMAILPPLIFYVAARLVGDKRTARRARVQR